MTVTVRDISIGEHRDWIRSQPSVSFLQTPAWGEVKTDWQARSIGWFTGGQHPDAAALVLLRKVPKLNKYLAYLPEGPALDWSIVAGDLDAWLAPMVAHLRAAGAFAITMGPPVWVARWHTGTIKSAIAAAQEGTLSSPRLADLKPDETNPNAEQVRAGLIRAGWRPPAQVEAFAAGQPQYVFQLPLAGRSEEELLAGFNQLWRRNIRKADKAGVQVRQGDESDLPAFHQLYLETAERDHFTPRPAQYFTGMWRAMRAEDPNRIRLFIATHCGENVAATLMTQVGVHVWYSYGASSSSHRQVRGSNAIQWAMMRQAMADGGEVYDLRGITDTLNPSDPLFGLIQFKVGTGGRAQSYLGEWTLPINRALYSAFTWAMRRR